MVLYGLNLQRCTREAVWTICPGGLSRPLAYFPQVFDCYPEPASPSPSETCFCSNALCNKQGFGDIGGGNQYDPSKCAYYLQLN